MRAVSPLFHLPAFRRGVIFIYSLALISAGLISEISVADEVKTKPTARHHQVNIVGFKFVPSELKVSKGDTITWINSDIAPHSVIIKGDAKELENIEITPILNSKQSATFTLVNGFNYQCGIHPSMKGKITLIPLENQK